MKYWKVDLRVPPRGQVAIVGTTIKDPSPAQISSLTNTQIYTTDPDIRYFASTIKLLENSFYSSVTTIDDVRNGKYNMETVKNVRHYFLLADKYEICGKISRITDHFKITGVMGLITVLTTSLRLGSPYDD